MFRMMAYLETYLLLQLVYQASSATNEVLNKRTNVDGGFWYQGELEGHKINLMNSTKETKSDIKYIDSIHSEGLHDRFDPHIVVPNGHKIDEDNPLEENFSLGPLQTQKVDGGERVQKNFWDTFYSHMKVPKGNKIDLSDSVEEPTFMIYEDSSDRKSPKMKTTIITNEINLHETTKESLPSTKTKERITLHEEGKDLLLRKRSNPNMKKPEQHRIHLEKEPRSTSTTNRQRKNVRGNEEIFDSSDEWVFPDLSMSFSMSYPLAKSSESLYSDGFIELSKEEIRDPPSISPTLEDQTDQIFFGSPQIPIGGEDMDTPIPEVSILDPSDTAKIDDVSNHLVSTTNHVPETAKLSKANEIGEITEQAPIIASINMPETKNVGTEKDESEDFPAAPESSSSLAARIHQDKSSSSSSLESNIGAMQSQSDISENQKDPILQSNQNLKDETHFPTLEPSGKSNILTDMVPTLSNVLSNFTEESYNESSQIGNSHICKDIIAADATTVTVRFKYNAQTIEDDKSFVPILEEVISDAVASQILECPNIYNRKLNASTRNLQRSRIIGVVPNPADVVLPGESCEVSVTGANICTVVDAKMTIIVGNGGIINARRSTLKEIQEGMETDAFLGSANPGLLKVSLGGSTAEIEAEEELIALEDKREAGISRVLMMLVALSPLMYVVYALVALPYGYIKRKLKRKRDTWSVKQRYLCETEHMEL